MSRRVARVLAPSMENIQLAAHSLKQGEVVGMPTETVYGLAGDAFQPQALARIFDTKERPTFDPLIIHVPISALSGRLVSLQTMGLVDASKLGSVARERVEKLMLNYWPGPLTLVLPKLPQVPDLATAGLATVAIRMPRHSVAQSLLAAAGTPLAAPSANRFGRISPTRVEHVMEELGDRIDFIMDGGPCEIGLESTVLAVAKDGTPSLLRPGSISREEIERLLGVEVHSGVPGETQGKAAAQMPAPGMLESHYAPEKILLMLTRPISALSVADEDTMLVEAMRRRPKKLGVLLMSGNESASATKLKTLTGLPATAITLSESGSIQEAAQNLFAKLRELDHTDADLLLVEPCPTPTGLGHAISDRLKRATTKVGPT